MSAFRALAHSVQSSRAAKGHHLDYIQALKTATVIDCNHG